MVTYTLVEKTETNVTFQIEDASQWNVKKEKDIKVKQMTIEEATTFFNNTKTQRQAQLDFITNKVNAEIASLDSIISQL